MASTGIPAVLSRLLGGVLGVGAFASAVWHIEPRPSWETSTQIVRDLGLIPLGPWGALSMAMARLAMAFPLGSQTFRLGLLTAAGAAVGAALLFHVMHRAARRLSPSPALAAFVSWTVAAQFVLSPFWAAFTTQSAWATVLLLLGLLVGLDSAPDAPSENLHSARRWAWFGAALGALVAENPLAASALLLALLPAALSPSPGTVPQPRLSSVRVGAALAAITFVLLWAPWVLRFSLPQRFTDLSAMLSHIPLSRVDEASLATSLFADVARLVGGPLAGVAFLGLCASLVHPSLRRSALPFAVLVLLASVTELLPTSPLLVELQAPLLLAGRLSLGVFLTTATLFVASTFSHLKSRTADLGMGMLVSLHLLVLALVLDTARHREQTESGASTWARHNVDTLPVRAATLIDAPQAAWLVWAEQVARGNRADVLVLPTRLLTHPGLTQRIALREPSTKPLLQAWLARSEPDEFGLSTLADVRPVLLQLDGPLARETRRHLEPHGFWTEYRTEPPGKSDRTAALAVSTQTIQSCVDALNASVRPDNVALGLLKRAALSQEAYFRERVDIPVAEAIAETTERLLPERVGRAAAIRGTITRARQPEGPNAAPEVPGNPGSEKPQR